MNCPICARASDAKYKPFCSRRCADIDLGKWLTGGYAIPAAVTDQDEDDEGAARLEDGGSLRQ
ncbi:DNA gyrase inhibitor YacG [Pseudorhodobacter sp.]|uniref:DNA gyrase inhibitor YacG n=1 Tax=Pseudorhodobacter sp. TaxID=1934400 RepID=UPI002AFDDD55|nr:DNA gyrase inhibitor YacG [Pseudorhodobacter sp.]